MSATATKQQTIDDQIRLSLPLDEAQILFDLLGNLILEKGDRQEIRKIYRRFEKQGFIHQDLL